MSSIATKTGDEGLQGHLRRLAQEVMSEILELDPSHSKELLGVFVSELFLSVAEQERREMRRQKQAEGIAAAKARGVRFGVQRKPLPANFDEYYEAWLDGRMSAVQASAACGMTRHTFSRAAHEKKEAANQAV